MNIAPVQYLTDLINERPDGFQASLPVPYFQMKFTPRSILLSLAKRFKALSDVPSDGGKRWLVVPGGERENQICVGCEPATRRT